MSQNGKGDKNRTTDRAKFRDNLDTIFNKPKKKVKGKTNERTNKKKRPNADD